jgi:hypothetical protein
MAFSFSNVCHDPSAQIGIQFPGYFGGRDPLFLPDRASTARNLAICGAAIMVYQVATGSIGLMPAGKVGVYSLLHSASPL